MHGTLLGLLRVDTPTRLVGTLALIAGICVYAMALEAVRRASTNAGDTEGTWYVGYTRDATNGLGFVFLWLAHFVLGFPLPIALVVGSGLTLFAYLADYLFARVLRLKHHTAVLIAVTVAASLPSLFAPSVVCRSVEQLLVRLFS